MKKMILFALFSSTLIGCTYYPKNYTYSPAVSVGGSNEGNLVLPSPFAKKSPKTIETTVEKTYVSRQEPVFVRDSYHSAPETTVVFVGEMKPY